MKNWNDLQQVTGSLATHLPNGIQLLLVQIPVVYVRSYLNAFHSQILMTPSHLLNSKLRILHGQSAKPVKLLSLDILRTAVLFAGLLPEVENLMRQIVVQQVTEIQSVLRLRPVVEHDGHGREHLNVDVVSLHIFASFVEAPAILFNAAKELTVLVHVGHIWLVSASLNADPAWVP